ncbi:MAG: hypothetical protein P1U35_14060 [Cycloclasticus sp.]|nr:hypothetical protein [Cycloclasticus sp.]
MVQDKNGEPDYATISETEDETKILCGGRVGWDCREKDGYEVVKIFLAKRIENTAV